MLVNVMKIKCTYQILKWDKIMTNIKVKLELISNYVVVFLGNMCVQPVAQSSRVGAITSNPWGQQHDSGFAGH